MIKSYKDCKDYEKSQIQQQYKMVSNKKINNKMYGYGEGVLFYFNQGKIAGSIKVVLEALKYLSTVYIHYLDIEEPIHNKEEIAAALIEAAIHMAKRKEANHILFGVRDNQILSIVKQLGYEPSYRAYKMKLTNRELQEKPLSLITLTEENKEEYLNVFNQSFSDMPHGCYYEMEEIEEYLNDKTANEYYMVQEDKQVIGFLNIEMDNGIGSMDLGLCPQYRGMGYGKRLLETGIHRMNECKLEKVTLTVIEKNERAMRMYEKRGFQVDYVIGEWIVIK